MASSTTITVQITVVNVVSVNVDVRDLAELGGLIQCKSFQVTHFCFLSLSESVQATGMGRVYFTG